MVRTPRILLPVIFSAIWLASCSGPAPYRVPAGTSAGFDRRLVRVLVHTAANETRIFSSSRITVRDIASGNPVLVTHGNALTISTSTLRRPVTIESSDAPLFVNDSQYRGYLEVRPSEGGMQVINLVSVRDYLLSVVPSEIPASWEQASLRAQAIAARTYLYHRLANPPARIPARYDVDSTNRFQVYKGLGVEQLSTSRAVIDTENQVMTWEGRPIIAYFHSTCGGRTADAGDVWTGPGQAYLSPVRCPYCIDSTKYRWSAAIRYDDIESALRARKGLSVKINAVIFSRHGGRVVSVLIRHRKGEIRMAGNNFRLLIPGDAIRSLSFNDRLTGRTLSLEGRGWGHGVGLCQWGARGMAIQGRSEREILRFYYRGIDIRALRGIPVARKRESVNAQ